MIVVVVVAFFTYWISRQDTPQGPTSVEKKLRGPRNGCLAKAPGRVHRRRVDPPTRRPPRHQDPSTAPTTTGSSGGSAAHPPALSAVRRRPLLPPRRARPPPDRQREHGNGSSAPQAAPLPAVEGGPIVPQQRDAAGAASNVKVLRQRRRCDAANAARARGSGTSGRWRCRHLRAGGRRIGKRGAGAADRRRAAACARA